MGWRWSGLTVTVLRTVSFARIRLEGEVKLLPEQRSVVCVNQLKHTLMDHVRLKTIHKHCSNAYLQNIFLLEHVCKTIAYGLDNVNKLRKHN